MANTNDTLGNPLVADMQADTMGNVQSVLAYMQWVRCARNPCIPSDRIIHGEWLLLEACQRALKTIEPSNHILAESAVDHG